MNLTIKDEKKPEILNEFLEYLRVIKNYSPKTIDGYGLDLMLFFKFYQTYQKINVQLCDFDIFVLSKVKTSDVISFLIYLNFKRDNNPCTRERKIASIRCFYKWLKYLNPKAIKIDPTQNIGAITKVERLPKYLSLENAQKIQNIFTKENSQNYIRNNSIISLFLSTGMRLSELININLNNIDLNNNVISVIGKGNKEREVYINQICKNNLQKYLEYRKIDINVIEKKPLFINNKGERIKKGSIEYICQKAYKLAGLEDYSYTVHTLRHTFATIIYKYVSQDILLLKKTLGHTSIKSTEIYTHVYNKQLKEAMDRHPLNCLNKKAV